MAKPNSAVGVCNLALDLIKEAPISSITSPTTKPEELCSRWYDLKRQSVLMAYNWNFALVSAAINRSGTPTITNFTDKYALPNDYLKLRAIIDPEFPLGRRRFEIQGTSLFYSNGEEDTLDIWYTADITNVVIWPALFMELTAHELALTLGKKLTARPSIMKDVKDDLKDLRLKARAVDGQIRPPKKYSSSRIVNAGLNISSGRFVAGDYEFPPGMDG